MSKLKLPTLKTLGEDDADCGTTKFQAGSLFKSHQKEVNSPEKKATQSQSIKAQQSSQATSTGSKPQTSTSLLQNQVSLASKRLADQIAPKEQSLGPIPFTSSAAKESTETGSQPESVSEPKPEPPVLRAGLPGKTSSLIVSRRQRGNPILKHVRNVPWEFGDIIPDYQVGQTSCALFLSLRYHALHPAYIQERIKQLGYTYDLRVLLVQVDVKDPHHSLKELAKLCLFTDCTMILAWSTQEAGTYLETFKAFENKPPDLIMEKMDTDFYSRMVDVLTTVKKVNKTDAATLISNFETMGKVVTVDDEELALCSGFGPQKAKRLLDAFHEPFLRSKKKKKESSKSKTDESNKTSAKEKR